MRTFCLFVGYPRSGHSIVGAMLNAHRHAVISNEADAPVHILGGCSRDELFARILAVAAWFHARGNRSLYSYAIPGQWQGRFETLQVIGDKRGGAVTRAIAEHPDFLDRVRALVRVPLRLVHVVRNPFDNIATISKRHSLGLPESVDFYFRHAETNLQLVRALPPSELITVRHEDLIEDPRRMLTMLCEFLGLTLYPGFLDDCAAVVFKRPNYSRQSAIWTPALVRDVEQRMLHFPFLAGYEFAANVTAEVSP